MNTFAIGLLLFIIYLVKRWLSRRHLPPGPPSVPILGSIPFVTKMTFELMTRKEMMDKYGKLVTFAFPEKEMIIINDFQLAKELFNKDVFSGRRMTPFMLDVRGDNGRPGGIINNVGHAWTEQRRFSLKALRDLGFGKNNLDSRIQDEVMIMINDFFMEEMETKGEVFMDGTSFNAPIINVLWHIVGSKRFDLKDAETKKLMQRVNDQFERSMTLTFLFPSLEPILPDRPTNEYIYYFKGMFRNMIMEHEQDHDPNSPPRDYIDQYLTESKSRNEPEIFNREQLVINCLDFFEAGTETSSTTLR